MKLGILLCGDPPLSVMEQHGDFSDLFSSLFTPYGFEIQTWRVVDMVFPDNITDADVWLVTGSKHGAYEDHPFIAPLETFIRDCFAAQRRMTGICFGHQIIAQAMGGRVEKYDGGWGIGRTAYALDGLGDVHLNAWHQDQVTTLPPSAEVVGASPTCANAALLYGDTIYTVQPHPELSHATIQSYLNADWPNGVYPDGVFAAAHQSLTLPNDEAALTAQIAAFLTSGRSAVKRDT
ncbi:type 1 glutamine amidotransferase [Celeribacter marinus]|uniref:GMP synthase n=1 Tax=Celeribacter marinus TaxID=1397108 RepID=A0A0N7HIX8_9RHOB|nr:type 1 glutamine amidotransferase [Celeribacter marinus]ALI56461.1 GMP synthase [Celeribacter marinus]SFK42584.1 GMP synthase (glutamine-hydrolysing) [Celeribacter marinus]